MANQILPQFSAYGVGRWHHPENTAQGASSHNASGTGCNAWPIFTGNWTLGITKIGVYSTGTTGDAGATDVIVQVGLYSAKTDGSYYPDALLHDTGAMTVNTTGIQTDGAFTEIQLSPNSLYWIASKKNNTPSNAAVDTAGFITAQGTTHMPYQTVDSGTGAQSDFTSVLKGSQAGAFPNPFAAGFVPATTIGNWVLPFFYVNSVA